MIIVCLWLDFSDFWRQQPLLTRCAQVHLKSSHLLGVATHDYFGWGLWLKEGWNYQWFCLFTGNLRGRFPKVSGGFRRFLDNPSLTGHTVYLFCNNVCVFVTRCWDVVCIFLLLSWFLWSVMIIVCLWLDFSDFWRQQPLLTRCAQVHLKSSHLLGVATHDYFGWGLWLQHYSMTLASELINIALCLFRTVELLHWVHCMELLGIFNFEPSKRQSLTNDVANLVNCRSFSHQDRSSCGVKYDLVNSSK